MLTTAAGNMDGFSAALGSVGTELTIELLMEAIKRFREEDQNARLPRHNHPVGLGAPVSMMIVCPVCTRTIC